MRLTKGQWVAAGIMTVAIVWVASGSLFSGGPPERAEAAVDAEAAAPAADVLSVRVRGAVAEQLAREVIIQGQTEASRRVELRAEVSGRVTELPVERGATVTGGDAIVQIAINDRAAKLEQAKALEAQRKLQAEAARDLAKASFSSKVRLAEAEAQYSQAKADVARFQLDLDNTTIRAPFDGVLDTRTIDDGAFVNIGDRIGTVVDLNPIHITGEVSERYVGQLAAGMSADVTLSDGSQFTGTLSYVASESNPSTKTFRVEVDVENPDSLLRAGLPAEIRLPLAPVLAHRVTSSILSLAETGEVGVKSVSSEDKIQFLPARILEDGPDGTWLGGLPEEFTLVVTGQDFVDVGQLVAPVPEN